MNKIKMLVSQAPLSTRDKLNINKSIRKIESAMPEAQTRKKNTKSQYVKNLFYENMFLEEKNFNKAETIAQNKGEEANRQD